MCSFYKTKGGEPWKETAMAVVTLEQSIKTSEQKNSYAGNATVKIPLNTRRVRDVDKQSQWKQFLERKFFAGIAGASILIN